MAKAVLCPVCSGSGKYESNVCHGCGGKGWVEVSDEHGYLIYPYPYPYPYPYLVYPEPWYSSYPPTNYQPLVQEIRYISS